MEKEFGYHQGYPEDIKRNSKVQKYMDEFQRFSTDVTPYSEDEEDPEAGRGFDIDVPKKDILYGKRIEEL